MKKISKFKLTRSELHHYISKLINLLCLMDTDLNKSQ